MCIRLRLVFLSGRGGCSPACFDHDYLNERFECAAVGSDACTQQWNNPAYHIGMPIACWPHLNSWVMGARDRWREAWWTHQEVDPWSNTVRRKQDILDPSLAQLGGYLAWRYAKLQQDYTRVVKGWILTWKYYLARGGAEEPAMEIVDLHTPFNSDLHRATAYFRSSNLRTRTHIDDQHAKVIRNIFMIDSYFQQQH